MLTINKCSLGIDELINVSNTHQFKPPEESVSEESRSYLPVAKREVGERGVCDRAISVPRKATTTVRSVAQRHTAACVSVRVFCTKHAFSNACGATSRPRTCAH